AFTVLFPSITASGIPKNAALNAIMQIEKTPRELYSGAILLLDDMRFDAALVLRSVFQDSQRCWIQAGAGIIAQSTPERELTETRE
ncbi:chorismate-binding protein, partial [Serratia marcescens]